MTRLTKTSNIHTNDDSTIKQNYHELRKKLEYKTH